MDQTPSPREEILNRIRVILSRPDLPFPPVDAPPISNDERIVVTEAIGDVWALARRFGEELQALHGTYEILESPVEARLAFISRIQEWSAAEEAARKGPKLDTGQERQILGWASEALPVDGIAETLEDVGWHLVAPTELRSPESREAVRFIRFGLTGVVAAFASTGSMLVMSGQGTSRSASLLPFHHIALIPFSKLYPTLEAWLAERRLAGDLESQLRGRAGWNLITGPSKSADIEMVLTLGVHGPKHLHAILFDDRH